MLNRLIRHTLSISLLGSGLIFLFLLSSCSASRSLKKTNSNLGSATTNTIPTRKNKTTVESFFSDNELRMFDFAPSDTGAHIFIPVQKNRLNKHSVVVFVHGYGALNPMIYGGWIRHLVNKGHVVIYPRYQEKILKPAAKYFVPNTVAGIKDAFTQLEKLNVQFDRSNFHLVGHSYGGVIISNLAAKFKEYQIPKPKSIFVCEGGTGPFTGGLLDDYTGIDASTLFTIIVGDNDQTVGTKFGDFLLAKVQHVDNFILVHQYEKDNIPFTASHYEPYSLDENLDTGHINYTSKKALRVSKIDAIDTGLYWPIFDTMIHTSKLKKKEPLSSSIAQIVGQLINGNDFIELRKK